MDRAACADSGRFAIELGSLFREDCGCASGPGSFLAFRFARRARFVRTDLCGKFCAGGSSYARASTVLLLRRCKSSSDLVLPASNGSCMYWHFALGNVCSADCKV